MDDARVRALAQQVLDDPGSHSPAQRFPINGLEDGDIPVWNSRSKTWVTRRQYNDTNPNYFLNGAGSWTRAQTMNDVSYIRIQGGTPAGFVADTNFRIYNMGGTVSTILEQDTAGRLRNPGNGSLAIDVAGTYLIGFYIIGPASGYEAGWTLTYNGGSIDATASNGVNYGGLGIVQPMAVSAMTITNFFTSPGYVQISGFQTTSPTSTGLWAMWLPV